MKPSHIEKLPYKNEPGLSDEVINWKYDDLAMQIEKVFVMPFWNKRAKPSSKSSQQLLSKNLDHWPRVKDNYQKNDFIFKRATNTRQSSNRLWSSTDQMIQSNHDSSFNLAGKRALSSSRGIDKGSLCVSIRKRLSNFFSGRSRSAGKLSASIGSVEIRGSSIQNILRPNDLGQHFDEKENQKGQSSIHLASNDSPICDIDGVERRARLAVPESICDDLEMVHDDITTPQSDKAPAFESVQTEANLHEAPSTFVADSKKRKSDKKPGYFNFFRRIIPAAEDISSQNSSFRDDALKSAFYNVAVFGMAACCIAGALAAYYLFYEFVKPIMWAAICGIVLYPLKRKVTTIVISWLDNLNSTGTPLALGVITLPLSITNGWGEFLLDSLMNNLKMVLLLISSFPMFALLLRFETIPRFLVMTKQFVVVVDHGMEFFKALWVPALLLIYVFYVGACNIFGHFRITFLCHPVFSWSIWIAGLGHISSYFGPLRIFLFSLILLLCVTYYIPIFHGLPSPGRLLPHHKRKSSKRPQAGYKRALGLFGRKWRSKDPITPELSPPVKETPPVEPQPMDEVNEATIISESNLYLKQLFVVCFFVYVSLHLWIMLLLIIPIGVALIRRLALFFDIHKLLIKQGHQLRLALGNDAALILPPPLVHFLRVLIYIDKQVHYYLRQSMDLVGSLTAMFLLVIGTTVLAGFVVFQLYYEGKHLIQLSADLANQTLMHNPTLQKWLRDNVHVESVSEIIEEGSKRVISMARNWISAKLLEAVGNDTEKVNLLEEQISASFDTLYDRLLQTNFTNNSVIMMSSSLHHKSAISQWADLWTLIGEGEGQWHLSSYLQDHLSEAWSIADSAWLIIQSNLELMIIAFTQIGSTLLASGTAVVDLFLDVIIFLTFLLYVLSESDEEYKPMKMIRDLVPGGGDTAATVTEQLEEAVNGVFFATAKIASFYGMLTWLTHTLFAVNLVFIPSVLAAIFAAVPFVGAYLVSLPAVLELWIIRGEPFLAILLFLLHYLPCHIVDDVFYSEISLTTPLISGMAIAGGMLWWGLEGAIFGPLVLCFILVLGGVYRTICYQTMAASCASTPDHD